MASETETAVFVPMNGTKVESPAGLLPGKNLQQIKDLMDSVKMLAAGDSFGYADELFNEMAMLKRSGQVNEDEVAKLKIQLQEFETNSRIAQQEFLKAHRNTIQSIEEERKELRFKLDRVQQDLESQQKINTEQVIAHQELQLETTMLIKENQGLREAAAQSTRKYKELESKSAVKVNTILELQQDIEHKDVEISNAKNDMRALEQERKDLADQFQTTESELRTLKGYCYPLSTDPYDVIQNSIKAVWRSCFDVVKTNVWKDLPLPKTEQDVTVWTTLKQVPEATYVTPVPASNTRAAKQMRTFLVMAVLSRLLTKHIFTPTYIIKEEDELRDALFEMVDDPKKKFLRGLIMSVFENKQKDIATQRVSAVVREVLDPIHGLLGLKSAQKFGEDLESKVQAAKDLWWRLQRHQSYIEADIKSDVDDWEWQSIRLSNENDQMTSRNVEVEAFDTDEVVLTLFPRIFIVDVSRDIPVFPGVVLQKSQTVSAQQEINELPASSPN